MFVPDNLRPDQWHPGGKAPGTVIDGRPRCGAWGRNAQRPCMKAPGWGTNHAGVGRCKLHGGSTPTRNQRYATVVPPGPFADAIRKFEAEGDPLNPLSELSLLRALLARFLAVNGVRLDNPNLAITELMGRNVVSLNADTLSTATKLVDNIGKFIGRIERVRAMASLSLQEVQLLVQRMAAAVERVVVDDQLLELIAGEWRILVAEATSQGSAAQRAAFAAGEEAE